MSENDAGPSTPTPSTTPPSYTSHSSFDDVRPLPGDETDFSDDEADGANAALLNSSKLRAGLLDDERHQSVWSMARSIAKEVSPISKCWENLPKEQCRPPRPYFSQSSG